MRIHLVNPSDVAFGVSVITPRWLYVLAAATPEQYGSPSIVDETLESIRPEQIQSGDVVGIGIHTANALRGYDVGRLARDRGAFVVFGGIHASLYPAEAQELGAAHAVVKGDGDVVWPAVLADCLNGGPQPLYDGGRVSAERFLPARWDLLPPDRYMWASVQTVRGCSKHCSFCSVWRMDGQKPRQRSSEAVIEEIVQLRRLGYRFIALADDNFYSATMSDIALAERRKDANRVAELRSMRAECFKFMDRLAELPPDTILFTQITMEAAEDPEFLNAMRKARIKGALVGVESVTAEGLKSIYKDFNPSGQSLVQRLRLFKSHGIHVLGSFIFGLSTDRQDTFEATADFAKKAELTFAQFVTMTPFPGTVDFDRWEKSAHGNPELIDGIPVTRYWLIPGHRRPKVYIPHPSMGPEEIRMGTQGAWNSYYSLSEVWKRAGFIKSLKARLAFVFISKLYRQMYANTGIAVDSARRKSANRWARWTGRICLRLFRGRSMPHLQVPGLPAASPK
jgi:radical SAM superfamily enzyme YgiQ (UPF0313 family)